MSPLGSVASHCQCFSVALGRPAEASFIKRVLLVGRVAFAVEKDEQQDRPIGRQTNLESCL